MKTGSTVQAHTGTIERRTSGTPVSRVELIVVSADCNDRPSSPISFQAVALVAAPNNSSGQSGVTEAPPLADMPGLAIGNSGTGTNAMRSVSTASSLNNYSARPTEALPASMQRGEVLHLPNIRLEPEGGPHGGSLVLNNRHDVRLERGTILLLSPAPVRQTNPTLLQQRSNKPESAAFPIPPSTSAMEEPPAQNEVCSDQCSQVKPADIASTTAARQLSLRALRYHPHDKQLRTEFGRETTLTYLDEDTLLCTFDPHFLREHDTQIEDGARTVRAVLIDTQTLAIKRVVEWRTRGNAAYLWRAGRGRVLVHIGHDLQLLDSKLLPLHSMHVHGRIAFVVASPAGDRFAVGTVRERYSAEVREHLAQDLADEPEEPVDVQVLDEDMHVVAEAERTTHSPPPLLADMGELRLSKQSADRWRLSLYTWTHADSSVAVLKSLCRPTLSVPAAGLVFALGCTASGHWYRMMRLDGRTLMKADSPSDELMQTSEEASAEAFAVRLVHASHPMSNGEKFGRDDLVREDVGVYRRSNGRSVAVVRTKNFALGRDTYALSPSGNTLVLAGTQELEFYAMPATP